MDTIPAALPTKVLKATKTEKQQLYVNQSTEHGNMPQ